MTRRQITIEQSGFITKETEERLLAIPGINREFIRAVLSIVQFANELSTKLPVYTPYKTLEEKQKVIALALLARLLDIVESALILSAHGVRQELKTLFRVFLDAYFLIANVCSDPKFLQVYLRTDEPERLKLLNAGAKQDHEIFSALKQYATEELRTELDQRIKDEKIQAFNSYLYAEKVNCTHLYDSMYRFASPSVHTGPRCLEEYVDADAQGYIIKIIRKGNLKTTCRGLYYIMGHFLTALRGVCELFAFSDTLRISELETELECAMEVQEQAYDPM